MTKNTPSINILWTGGLDSTYRICELSGRVPIEIIVELEQIV